jgi:hypothetical protein
VEWSSEPVNRPENSLTGAGFARGAGSRVITDESFTTRFADHWAFEGTGLRDGDPFGRGSIGRRTDAVDYEEVDGVPQATGRDGTPPSFVILATADLKHWRRYGKDGAITMGVHHFGAGTVFNAATMNWGNSLHDPVLDRITRNVLDRLSTPRSASRWEVIGTAPDIDSLTVCDGMLFGLAGDELRERPLGGQNLNWRPAGHAGGVITIAAPREAHSGLRLGLYGVTSNGILRYRDSASTWEDVGDARPGTIGLALADDGFFAIADNELWHLPMHRRDDWIALGTAAGARCVTAMNGRLYAVAGNRLLTRTTTCEPEAWQDLGLAAGSTALAAWMGRIIGAGTRLRWRVAQSSVS